MNYILDTHAFIWYAEGNSQLSPKVKLLIDNLEGTNQIFLSMVSIWEMSIKLSIGKLKFQQPFRNVIDRQIVLNNYQVLNLEIGHTEKIVNLPFFHRDPFDRLLIAQSLVENIPIISRDSNFSKYKNLSVIW